MNLRREEDFQPKKVDQITEISEFDLHEKSFCITGTIPNLTRYEALRAVYSVYCHLGETAKMHNSILKSTDYLIVGEDPGQSKIDKAKRYNIPMISYKDKRFDDIFFPF